MDESRRERNLRILAFVDRWFIAFVILCIAIGGIGAYATYTAYADPGEREVENVVSTINFAGGYDHSATVIADNPVFPLNSELRGRSAYPARVAPILNGSYQISYTADSSSDVSVELETIVLLRAVDDETVYWSDTILSDSLTRSDVASGETVELPFSVNVTSISQRQEQIEEIIGTFPGDTETVIRSDARVVGQIEGESETYARQDTLRIDISDAMYGVTVNETGTENIERVEVDTIERQRGAFMSIGGPVAILLSLVGLAGLGAVRWQEQVPLTEGEREWLDYRDDRSEFDEWITSIDLPSEVLQRPEGTAESLADLVDFAIDSDQPIVEDPETGHYFVLADDNVYRFTPPSQQNIGILESQSTAKSTTEGEADTEESKSLDEPESESESMPDDKNGNSDPTVDQE